MGDRKKIVRVTVELENGDIETYCGAGYIKARTNRTAEKVKPPREWRELDAHLTINEGPP